MPISEAAAELLFASIKKLVLTIVSHQTKEASKSWIQKKHIERVVSRSVEKVAMSQAEFLANEGLTDDQQALLASAAMRELEPVAAEPARLFKASLSGTKLYQQLYAERELPEEVREEGMEGAYELMLPAIGELMCQAATHIEEWRQQGFRETFERFDEIAEQLSQVQASVERLSPPAKADAAFHRLRKKLTQEVFFELEVGGLRADSTFKCGFDDLFVHPSVVRHETTREAIHDTSDRVSAETLEESVATFMAPGQRALIEGGPGAGKSTWTRALTKGSYEANSPTVIVHQRLRELREDELPSVHDLVRSKASTNQRPDLDDARVGRWLDAGDLAFIFDGFDEVAPGRRDAVLAWLQDLNERLGRCPLVLTSRPLTSDHHERLLKPKPWRAWGIEAFDDERIKDYTQRWHAHVPEVIHAQRPVDVDALVAHITTDPTLSPLTRSPLMLTTLLLVHQLDGELPEGRTELYGRYIDGMLGGWDARNRVEAEAVQLKSAEKRALLRQFAIHMQMRETELLDEEEALSVVAKQLEAMAVTHESQAVLDAIRERSGLLEGPGSYSFVHKSVGEFLVAEAIIQGNLFGPEGERVDRYLMHQRRHDDRWNTVIFFWAGMESIKTVSDWVVELIAGDEWTEDKSLGLGVVLDQWGRLGRELEVHLVDLIDSMQYPADSGRFNNLYFIASLRDHAPVTLDDIAQTIHSPVLSLHAVLRSDYLSHFYSLLSRLAQDRMVSLATTVQCPHVRAAVISSVFHSTPDRSLQTPSTPHEARAAWNPIDTNRNAPQDLQLLCSAHAREIVAHQLAFWASKVFSNSGDTRLLSAFSRNTTSPKVLCLLWICKDSHQIFHDKLFVLLPHLLSTPTHPAWRDAFLSCIVSTETPIPLIDRARARVQEHLEGEERNAVLGWLDRLITGDVPLLDLSEA